MADTLEQMGQKIQEYKEKYAEYKKYFTSEESLGGTAITPFEQGCLTFINNAIISVESEIKKRKELLTKVTITDVKDHYSLLFKRINHFVDDKVDNTYIEWQKHIVSVGSCYAKAFDIFEKTVEAQDKYKADLANIAGSILSIAGIGTLSWLSTTGKLAAVLTKLSATQVNVVEDIAQGAWDKAVSYGATQWPSSMKKDFTGPLVFQNTFSLKILKGYQAVRTELLKHAGAAIACEAKMLEYQTAKTGNAKSEYEKFIKFEANVIAAIAAAKNWVTNTPPSIDTAELTKDLERGFWAGWIPRLKGYRTVRLPSVDEFGVSDPNGSMSYKVDTFDTWFSSDLKKRLTLLIPLEGIGVGKDGLWWVSENDVKLLISWANSFNPTQKF